MTDNTQGLSEDPEKTSGTPDDDQFESVVEESGEQDVPAGDELGAELRDPEPFEVVDDEAEELDVDPDDADQVDDTPGEADPDDVVIEDPEQLAEATTAASKVRSSRPVRKAPAAKDKPAGKKTTVTNPAASTAKKGRATRSQADALASRQVHHRTTPATFVNQSVGELKKVNWPTGSQLRQYFVVVLAFVLFIIAYVGLLDFGFGWVLLKALGSK